MAKLNKKKVLLTSLALATPLVGAIASACSLTNSGNNDEKNENKSQRETLPQTGLDNSVTAPGVKQEKQDDADKNKKLSNPDESTKSSNADDANKNKKLEDTNKDTKPSDASNDKKLSETGKNELKSNSVVSPAVDPTKKASEVAKTVNSRESANAQIKDASKQLPEIPADLSGFAYEISATGDDATGTLTISVALKKGDQYFDLSTGQPVNKAAPHAKTITVTGFLKVDADKNKKLEDTNKDTKPSDASNDKKLSETGKNELKSNSVVSPEVDPTKKASEVAKTVNSRESANAQIKDASKQLPEIPADLTGFAYEISATGDDATGTLTISVALKKGDQYFDLSTGKPVNKDAPHAKTITVTGFLKVDTDKNKKQEDTNKDTKPSDASNDKKLSETGKNELKSNSVVSPAVDPAKKASEVAKTVNSRESANAQIKDVSKQLPEIPAELTGFAYEISATGDDATGTLTISVALKKGDQYFDLSTGKPVSKDAPHAKTITVTGFLK